MSEKEWSLRSMWRGGSVGVLLGAAAGWFADAFKAELRVKVDAAYRMVKAALVTPFLGVTLLGVIAGAVALWVVHLWAMRRADARAAEARAAEDRARLRLAVQQARLYCAKRAPREWRLRLTLNPVGAPVPHAWTVDRVEAFVAELGRNVGSLGALRRIGTVSSQGCAVEMEIAIPVDVADRLRRPGYGQVPRLTLAESRMVVSPGAHELKGGGPFVVEVDGPDPDSDEERMGRIAGTVE